MNHSPALIKLQVNARATGGDNIISLSAKATGCARSFHADVRLLTADPSDCECRLNAKASETDRALRADALSPTNKIIGWALTAKTSGCERSCNHVTAESI